MIEPTAQDMDDPEFAQAWEQADEQDRLRHSVSIGELVAEDAADPDTPDHFDVELVAWGSELGDQVQGFAQPGNAATMVQVATLLRSWGWRVLESPGWRTRGVAGVNLNPTCVVVHHTAAAVDIDRMLRDGRSDLAGPLCNFALHGNGDVVLMAAGKANHAGVASVNGSKAWGIEATGPVPVSGRGKAAFPNYKAYIALCVAIRMVEGWPVSAIRAHKEVALPDGRKPDPAFGSTYPKPYSDMDVFRRECNVARVLRAGDETSEELSMADVTAIVAELKKTNGTLNSMNGTLGVIVRGDPGAPPKEETHPENMEQLGQVLRNIERTLKELLKVLTPPPTGGAS